MAKKLIVWLNNKLNKSLHCTVIIQFYCIFITELIITFFVFKFQNHFEFPKDGKYSLLKNSGNSWGEGGSSKTPLERKILRGGVQIKESSVGGGGVWIFLEQHHSAFVSYEELWRSRRVLSADNTLLDLHNSSYDTQPH